MGSSLGAHGAHGEPRVLMLQGSALQRAGADTCRKAQGYRMHGKAACPLNMHVPACLLPLQRRRTSARRRRPGRMRTPRPSSARCCRSAGSQRCLPVLPPARRWGWASQSCSTSQQPCVWRLRRAGGSRRPCLHGSGRRSMGPGACLGRAMPAQPQAAWPAQAAWTVQASRALHQQGNSKGRLWVPLQGLQAQGSKAVAHCRSLQSPPSQHAGRL